MDRMDVQQIEVLRRSPLGISVASLLRLNDWTARELARELGRQKTSVARELRRLERHGYIECVRTESRGERRFRLTRVGSRAIELVQRNLVPLDAATAALMHNLADLMHHTEQQLDGVLAARVALQDASRRLSALVGESGGKR